jgi:putative DNA primase/helicase
MDKLDQTLVYAWRGWPIFPLRWIVPGKGTCSCGDANCRSPGKHPILPGGFKIATTDESTLRGWHKVWPHANWGMRTGDLTSGGSGILVVDIDARNHGFDTWEVLRANHPDREETITVVTGNLGLHYWFMCPPDGRVRSSAGKLGRGLDIRSEGGYVVVPPSVTANPYTFKLPPETTTLLQVPEWLLAELRSPRTGSPSAEQEEKGMSIPQGRRHDALLSVAALSRQMGLNRSQIKEVLCAYRDRIFKPGDHPVTDLEINAVVAWITGTIPVYNNTDMGNALRFHDQHKADLLFCFKRNDWITWDGTRWDLRGKAEVLLKAQETLRSIHYESARLQDKGSRTTLKQHALRSESAAKETALLHKSRPLFNLGKIRLDQHPELLTVRNGTLHLPDGVIQPHDKKNYLTRRLDLDYIPGTPCPAWKKFLTLVTQGDRDLATFLQTAVGYTLSGNIDEQVMFTLYGMGANGKSTFVETMKRMMGEFAERVPIEALMEARNPGAGPKPEILKMKGARMVLTSEVPFNRKMNESLVKDLTGGDSISARGLYQEEEETFKPTHKIWMVGNHKPEVHGTDEGILRRFRMIPFEYTFPVSERRPMREVMAEFNGEMEGIFAWAVEGCIRWYGQRLGQVKAVQEATDLFRSDLDIVGQFIGERCLTGPNYTVSKDTLYQTWREWCEANGEVDSLKRTKRWLNIQFLIRGCSHHGNSRLSLKGVGLISPHGKDMV